MKYLFMPVWRLFVCLFVLFAQSLMAIGYVIAALWNLKLPVWKISSFYFEIEDGCDVVRQCGFDKSPVPYYKNPIHALLGRVTYIPLKDCL